MDELYETTHAGGLSTSWQEYLQMQAHAVRTLAVTHPRIFPLVATRPPSAPWLRPPLRSLRWVESFLQGLREYGFSPRVSVAVYRSFATFLLGALLLEAGTLEDLTITEKVNLAFIETDDLSSYPIISEMADELKDGGFEVEFEAALEDLIERVAVMRPSWSQARPRSRDRHLGRGSTTRRAPGTTSAVRRVNSPSTSPSSW